MRFKKGDHVIVVDNRRGVVTEAIEGNFWPYLVKIDSNLSRYYNDDEVRSDFSGKLESILEELE